MLSLVVAAQIASMVPGICPDEATQPCTLAGCAEAVKTCSGGYWRSCRCIACDDGNPCTSDVYSGGCVFTPTAGATCSDSNACTTNDVCDGTGQCRGTLKPAVSDGNACTSDSCDPATGQPTHPPVANGTSCSDQNACTTSDTCNAGQCTGTPKAPVSDGNACTVDSCSPATGQPTYPPVPDGAPCSDLNACTTNDACSAGSCSGTPRALVSDGNECTVDSCDRASGQPSYGWVSAGEPCDASTGAGLCNGSGACVGASATTFCYDARGNVTRKHVCPSGQTCSNPCGG
jgi:hypothetical protein